MEWLWIEKYLFCAKKIAELTLMEHKMPTFYLLLKTPFFLKIFGKILTPSEVSSTAMSSHLLMMMIVMMMSTVTSSDDPWWGLLRSAAMSSHLLGLFLTLLALIGFFFNIYIVLALVLTKQVSPVNLTLYQNSTLKAARFSGSSTVVRFTTVLQLL